MIEHLGNRLLDAYSTADAASFGGWLLERQLSSTSIQRIFSTIRAAFNLSIYEDGLTFPNAFAKTYLTSDERPKRASISPEDIKRVQKDCLYIADERRLIIALIFDTEMRLSEASGLVWDDFTIQHQYTYITLVPNFLAPLKLANSKRLIPLSGAHFEAIKILHHRRVN